MVGGNITWYELHIAISYAFFGSTLMTWSPRRLGDFCDGEGESPGALRNGLARMLLWGLEREELATRHLDELSVKTRVC